MPLASTNLAPLCLIAVLHTSFYTTKVYTSQLLHQHSFTPGTCCRNLLKTPTSFYTNPLLHKPLLHQSDLTRAFTRTSFYANQLFDQPAFTQTTFCYNQLFDQPAFTQISFYTNQLFGQSTFLRKPPWTPTSSTQPLLWACRPKARGRRNAEGCHIYIYIQAPYLSIYLSIYLSFDLSIYLSI